MLQRGLNSSVRWASKTRWTWMKCDPVGMVQLEWNSSRKSSTGSKQPPASSSSSSASSKTTPSKEKTPRMAYVPSPSPPALEPKEQKEFLALLRRSNQPSSSSRATSATNTPPVTHPDLIETKGPVEFEGDINPRTGEVNGPKRDPLKWPNEWGYGGRATDF